jgi:integrase
MEKKGKKLRENSSVRMHRHKLEAQHELRSIQFSWVQFPSPAFLLEHTDFLNYLRQHIREVTANAYIDRLRRLNRIGNLDNPEQIKNLICTYQASESYKELLTSAYDYWVKYRSLKWKKPHFVRQEKPIFIPLEKELDALIARFQLKMSVFLQLLKETGADSGEAWKLRWIDINVENKTVSITPTKNHSARTLPVSSNLLSRMLQLPRKAERIFNCKSLDGFRTGYEVLRNKLSIEMNNPRLREIAFRSFRHWKATTEYYKTKDILHVKWLLGHKRLENTLIYTHLVSFGSDDYVCKTAKNLDEATQLVEAGFEYVTEMDGVKLFRKRK